MFTSENVVKKNVSPLCQLVKNEPNLLSFLKDGDLVEAKLLKKTNRIAYFDLGKFGTGIVSGNELSNAKNTVKELKEGEVISAKIINVENDDSYVELSLAGAHRQKNWQEIKEIKETDEAIPVKIIGANSGGLMAEINNIRAFLPVSQLSGEHYPRVEDADKTKILEELKKLVGQEISVKIIDFNPRANKLIISEREAMEQNLKDIVSQYKVGDVIEGIVSGVADFGVFIRFVDNPSIEGLVHISELDHCIIDNPKEIVKIDEVIKVKIVEIKNSQISLSLKALKSNPWDTATDNFKEGQEVKGLVYKFTPFGAYVNLEHGLQGLIHVSEFGSLDKMKEQMKLKENYKFIIESIKSEDKRIVLKFKK